MIKLHDIGRLPPVMREFGLGALYWFAFLIVLEPDNLLRALRAGSLPSVSHEVFRIVGASLLGACTAPLLFALVRRFPVAGKLWWRHTAILAASCAVVSAALIAVSSVLAYWFLPAENPSLSGGFVREFISNWLLLAFCVAGFLAIAHALRFFSQLA